MGKTYYLKTAVGGMKDRAGYLAALNEWERLKSFIDGFGPSPHTNTSVLIPAGCEIGTGFQHAASHIQLIGGEPAISLLEQTAKDPSWIFSRGIFPSLHPELVVSSAPVFDSERRLANLIDLYLTSRRNEAERGDLSLKQYDEDSTGLKIFGEGEWKMRKHGKSKRRTWRKLHLAIDTATQEIVAEVLTANSGSDAD